MDAMVRIFFILFAFWIIGTLVFELVSWLWTLFLEMIRVLLLGTAALLINVLVAFEKVLGLWHLPHPAWSWALTGGVFGTLLYFGCAQRQHRRRRFIVPATLMLALAWLYSPSALERQDWPAISTVLNLDLPGSEVFKDWAIAVQLGHGDVRSESDLGLDAKQRGWVQKWLNALGFDAGATDGVFGARTRAALTAYARPTGSGYLTQALYERLRAEGTRALAERLSPGTIDSMRPIRGGCFRMGNPATEEGRGHDERQHDVCLEDFRIAKSETTVEEFGRFISATGYRTEAERVGEGKGGCRTYDFDDASNSVAVRAWATWRSPTPDGRAKERHPVSCVSWNDVMGYVNWLNASTGAGFRLPTEAEWEYAARAGTETPWPWGRKADAACRYANLADLTAFRGFQYDGGFACTDKHFFAAPVCSFPPNRWGLCDMAGNVMEWTCSVHADPDNGESTQCRAPGDVRLIVVRGGGFGSGVESLRAASRGRRAAVDRHAQLGFRLAMPAATGSKVTHADRRGSAE